MEKLNINIFNLIILMGIIQGFIFGFIIIFNRKLNNKTNIFLSLTVFSLTISNLQYWLEDSNLVISFPYLNFVRVPTEFLIIPMFYLFVNNYIERKMKPKYVFLLILPFTIDFVAQIFLSINLYFFQNNLISESSIFYFLVAEEIFSFSYSFILIVLTLLTVKRYENENLEFAKTKVKANTKWLKHILLIGLFSCSFWVIEIIVMYKYAILKGKQIYYPLWICITFIIYWLSYAGLFQSTIFLERKKIRKDLVSKENNSYNNGKSSSILEDFKKYIESNYSNPHLNLDLVSNEIRISTNYLSQIINSNNLKFTEYTNQLRIEKAKEMIISSDYSQYTITSIGLEAGFNSNASFYRAFKKEVGQSPTEFRKNLSQFQENQ